MSLLIDQAAGPDVESDRRDMRDQRWLDQFERLKTWAGTHGSTWVPRSDPVLGSWVSNQRYRYRRGELADWRLTALESLPGWSEDRPGPMADPSCARWWRRFTQLRFIIDTSHEVRSSVPQGLRNWAGLQRDAAEEGRLNEEQLAAFRSLPSWVVPRRSPPTWEDNLARLRGACLGQQKLPADLEGWACRVRQHFRTGRLSSEKVLQLEQVPGWAWNGRRIADNRRWRRFVDDVRAAVVQGADLSELEPHGPPGSLARRAQTWRSAYYAGRLSPEQMAELADLPGWRWDWRVRSAPPDLASWYRKLDDLKAIVGERHSSCGLRLDGAEGRVGRWAATQRRRWREGRLTAEQIQALDLLEGWAWTRQAPQHQNGAEG